MKPWGVPKFKTKLLFRTLPLQGRSFANKRQGDKYESETGFN